MYGFYREKFHVNHFWNLKGEVELHFNNILKVVLLFYQVW